MISSRPIACHVLHCCCLIGVLKWLDLWKTESPPSDRVVTAACLVIVSVSISTGLCLLLKNSKTSGPNVIKDVRKKSRKYGAGLDTSGNEIADSGSELIELSAERKLTKRTAELAVTVISFAVFLHVATILLGAPFIRFAERTAALSCTIAALTLLPLVHEAEDKAAQQSFCRQFADFVLVKGQAGSVSMERMHLLSVVWGTWFACMLQKLDWKQVWQEYPVPGLSGALIASLCCHVTYLIQVCLRQLLLHANY